MAGIANTEPVPGGVMVIRPIIILLSNHSIIGVEWFVSESDDVFGFGEVPG